MCLPDGDMSKYSWADFNSFLKISRVFSFLTKVVIEYKYIIAWNIVHLLPSITIDDDESLFLDIKFSFVNTKFLNLRQ
jgi:hypothetical protein